MLTADRFLANKAIDFDGWIRARETGITATQVANAATPAGYQKILAELRDPTPIEDNDYMRFGREQEGPISMWVKVMFDIMPNEWLIIAKNHSTHLATPDGLSLTHDLISEIKTTRKDWGESKIPIAYRRQVQWQLHVTGAERCLFAWMLRVESMGEFVPGWMEPKWMWMERDDEMIESLSVVANKLWADVNDAE